MHLALQPPRLCQAEVVTELLQQGDRGVGDGDDVVN